jgi:hypothetical protein
MVFNATFSNISIILLQSVLLVEETKVKLEKTTDKLYHIMQCPKKFVWASKKLESLVQMA